MKRVLYAIQTLPPNQREAVTLFYIGGYSYREVSLFLDVPEKIAKSHLHSARNMLKQRDDRYDKRNPTRTGAVEGRPLYAANADSRRL